MNDLLREIRPAGFAPLLYIKILAPAIEFYKKAFGAIELRRHSHDDGTVHVVEMAIGQSLFRMHEESPGKQELSPDTLKGTTVLLGLLVEDPDIVIRNAVAAGAEEISPVQDYEYGFRQGTVKDPFGHHWQIEKMEMVN